MKKSTLFCWLGAVAILLALFCSPAATLVANSSYMVYGEDPLLKRLRQAPPEFFESNEALEKWATDSSEWHGEIRGFQGNESQTMMVAFRSFTTTLESSEAAIYLRDVAGSWRLVLHRQPVFHDVIDVSREADRLILSTRKGGKTLIEIPFDGLEPAIPRTALIEIEIQSMVSPIKENAD